MWLILKIAQNMKLVIDTFVAHTNTWDVQINIFVHVFLKKDVIEK